MIATSVLKRSREGPLLRSKQMVRVASSTSSGMRTASRIFIRPTTSDLIVNGETTVDGDEFLCTEWHVSA